MSNHFFADTAVMLGRSMRHITRSPDTIITTAITPIALMLLFVYVFGGAIQIDTDNYVNYLLPGIMLIAIASGIAYTALRLFTDMKSGLLERFHSMPIPRSSVLWAHVVTSLVANALTLVTSARATNSPRNRAPGTSAKTPSSVRTSTVPSIPMCI